MNTNPNDSANPEIHTDDQHSQLDGSVYSNTYSFGGLTKREYFAAIALQGLLAANYSDMQGNTITAVQHADDLIKQLNKETPGYDNTTTYPLG